MSKIFDVSKEDKKMLDSIFWRSFAVFACPMPAYRQAPGFTFSIAPALDCYYPENDKRAEAMVRHTTPYNITQAVGTFAMGLAASMEKENAANYGAYDTSAIPAIKTSLMGPLSGIGDALFWGIVRTIATSVGISLAATGSILAPIAFLILYNIPNVVCRYFMTYLGYTLGETFLKEAYESGFVSILTKAAGIVGIISNQAKIDINAVQNYGTVNVKAEGLVRGIAYAGGILALAGSPATGSQIIGSTNNGNITITSDLANGTYLAHGVVAHTDLAETGSVTPNTSNSTNDATITLPQA